MFDVEEKETLEETSEVTEIEFSEDELDNVRGSMDFSRMPEAREAYEEYVRMFGVEPISQEKKEEIEQKVGMGL